MIETEVSGPLLDLTNAVRGWLSNLSNMKSIHNGERLPYSFGTERFRALESRAKAEQALIELEKQAEKCELTPLLKQQLIKLRDTVTEFVGYLDNPSLSSEIKDYCVEILTGGPEIKIVNRIFDYFKNA